VTLTVLGAVLILCISFIICFQTVVFHFKEVTKSHAFTKQKVKFNFAYLDPLDLMGRKMFLHWMAASTPRIIIIIIIIIIAIIIINWIIVIIIIIINVYVCMYVYCPLSQQKGITIGNVLILFFSPVNVNFNFYYNYY
jgi:hypothetical protein